MKKFVVLFAILLVLTGTGLAQKDKGKDDEDEPLATMKFVVLRDYNGKPIRNASVVLHPVAKNGKQERGGIQLKCDADGKAMYDGVPYGKLRVQVLTPGFQTFGEDYEVNQPQMEIVIKLKRPQEQYSIYTDKQGDKKDDSTTPPASDSTAKPK